MHRAPLTPRLDKPLPKYSSHPEGGIIQTPALMLLLSGIAPGEEETLDQCNVL